MNQKGIKYIAAPFSVSVKGKRGKATVKIFWCSQCLSWCELNVENYKKGAVRATGKTE